MYRTARRLFAAILAVLALFVVGTTAAFAKVAPDGPGTFQPSSRTPTHTGNSMSFAQWIGAGAAAALVVLVIYVAATALVHRHQQVAGRQLAYVLEKCCAVRTRERDSGSTPGPDVLSGPDHGVESRYVDVETSPRPPVDSRLRSARCSPVSTNRPWPSSPPQRDATATTVARSSSVGEPGDCMYVIIRGAVGISIQSPDGGEALLAVLEPPASFGELAVVDHGPRVAMATARQATELLRIERGTVLDLVATEPVVGAALISSLVAMVRRVDEQTSDLALLGLPLRVRKHLLGAALHQHGSRPVPPGGAIHIDLRINQTDLARQVGGSRQQVNRILAALDGAGAIERMGHRIVAVRPHLLAVEEVRPSGPSA